MISPKKFYNEHIRNKVNFFAGVPDSLLKDICAFINDNTSYDKNIITANEGGAVALATGYHLATDNIPLVYMQNSGIGNAINPILSLADKEVYSIPMILLIGWRGEPGVNDEPQHIKQGRVTPTILESMEIPYQILDSESDYLVTIENAVKTTCTNSAPVAILVKKNTFAPYKLNQNSEETYKLTREESLEKVLKYIPDSSIIVSTTGMLSRELFELREIQNQPHDTDFLTVGSMGHTSQIALGIALAKPNKQIFCFDGDGSALMHLGNYAIAGILAPKNLKIIVFNNGAHDSVGGQQTIGHRIDLSKIAEATKFRSFGSIGTFEEIEYVIPKFTIFDQISFLEIRIKRGARVDLGRPTTTPQQNKELLKSFIKK